MGKGVTRRRKAGAKKAREASPHVRKRGHPDTHLEPLTLELFGFLRGLLASHGLSPSRMRRLFEQSGRQATFEDVSGPLLEQFRGLGDLVAAWLEEGPYVDEVGKPRLLAIEGSGATFESLARRFLPGTSVATAVDLACQWANAGTLPGDRIALFGDTMVNFAKSSECALAQTVSHIRKVAGTCQHNVQSAQDGSATGRLERIVGHELTREEFEQFSKVIRLQLHDQCERADRVLKGTKNQSRKAGPKGTAGIGLYVYFDAKRTPRRKGSKRPRRKPAGQKP